MPRKPRPADRLRHPVSEGELFENVELRDADFSEKVLVRCTFRGVRLEQSRWNRARLEDCRFEGCDLSRAVLDGTSLREVEFTRCKLLGIDWSAIGSFPAMRFTDCLMRYGIFVKLGLRGIELVRCSLVEASFAECDLQEARFEECALAGARFENCDLRKASFTGSTGLVIDPRQNRVQGARVPQEAALAIARSFGLEIE